MGKRVGTAFLLAILTLGSSLVATPAGAQGGTVIASDNFNRADEVPFAVGGNWGRVVAGNYDGTSRLIGNQVVNSSNEGIYYWQGAGTFDPTRQFARQRVVQKDGEVGLVLLGGPDHSIMVGWGPPGVGSTVYIYWYSDGLDRGQLTTAPSTVNNGDIIEASLENGVIYAKVNGNVVASVANTTTLTSGTPGFVTYGDVNLPGFVGILDDWEAGTPTSYAISGTITENAAGLAGVLVTASGGFSGSATTNGSGDYSITGVPPNATSIVLTPVLAGHDMSPVTRTVAGPVTADVTGQDFTSTVDNTAELTINANHGTVTRDPDQPSYTFGTPVTLTPVPDVGYVFADWTGDVPPGHGTDNPLQITMDQDRTITAKFVSANVVAFDHFNRADETPLVVGGNWAQPFNAGNVQLVNNQVAGASGEALYYWQGPGAFDNARQYARASVVQASGEAGLLLLGGNNQALIAAWSEGTVYIYWYMGGVHQGNLATAPSTLQAGDVIELQLDAGTVYARVNGNVVASVANTTTLVAGQPGFETYLTGGVLDDWEAGTAPAPATIDILASAGAGGTITPSGTVSVAFGGTQAFSLTPDSGFLLDSLYVDGVSVTPASPYTFTNAIANHTIHATFAAVTGVGAGPVTAFALSPMSPNPVRGSTRFQFALPSGAPVHIGLHDVQGRELQVLADGAFPAGRHALAWSNAGASRLHPGLYFVRMTVPGRTMVRRLVLAN